MAVGSATCPKETSDQLCQRFQTPANSEVNRQLRLSLSKLRVVRIYKQHYTAQHIAKTASHGVIARLAVKIHTDGITGRRTWTWAMLPQYHPPKITFFGVYFEAIALLRETNTWMNESAINLVHFLNDSSGHSF